jgi:hypothetical protein
MPSFPYELTLKASAEGIAVANMLLEETAVRLSGHECPVDRGWHREIAVPAAVDKAHEDGRPCIVVADFGNRFRFDLDFF